MVWAIQDAVNERSSMHEWLRAWFVRSDHAKPTWYFVELIILSSSSTNKFNSQGNKNFLNKPSSRPKAAIFSGYPKWFHGSLGATSSLRYAASIEDISIATCVGVANIGSVKIAFLYQILRKWSNTTRSGGKSLDAWMVPEVMRVADVLWLGFWMEAFAELWCQTIFNA